MRRSRSTTAGPRGRLPTCVVRIRFDEVGITLLGYFLGNIKWLGDNLDFALLAILAVFAIPLVIEWRRELARSRD